MFTKNTYTLTALALLLLGARVHAQNINAYRFWYDHDISAATLVTVPGTPVLNLNTALSGSGLGKGLHVLGIQFRDNNNVWSVAVEEPFARIDDQITAYQYWFDTDVANAQTTTVAGAGTLDLSANIPTGALFPGQHTITMRFKDGFGNWSVEQTKAFAKSGANLTAWQYWFDDNVTALVETAAGPNATINVAQSIDASGLSNGVHNITWRMKDSMGNWSVPVSQDFDLVLGITEIPGIDRLLLFPNPANERLTLRVDASTAQALRIDVLDATGRTVLLPVQRTFSGGAVEELTISELAPGTYHVRVSNATGTRDVPFVKQ
jgi:Secretion system C-terminal sorting domain